MGRYSGDFVPLNIHKLDHCSKKLYSRVLTLKALDSLEISKSLGPRFVHESALQAAKYAISTHLQFNFNECIQNSVVPTNLKHAYVTKFEKKINNTSVQLSTHFGQPTFC